MATLLDIATFARAAYGDDPLPKGPWTALVPMAFNFDHYYGQAYINDETKEVIITHRGTSSLQDLLVSDMQLTLHALEPAELDAIAYASEIADWVNDNRSAGYTIINTGHSLGGNLAQAADVALEEDPNPGEQYTAVTFNAPGLGFIIPENQASSYHVLNINTQGDLIHYAGGTHLGQSITIPAGPSLLSVDGLPLLTLLQHYTHSPIFYIAAALFNTVGPAHSINSIVSYLTDSDANLGQVDWGLNTALSGASAPTAQAPQPVTFNEDGSTDITLDGATLHLALKDGTMVPTTTYSFTDTNQVGNKISFEKLAVTSTTNTSETAPHYNLNFNYSVSDSKGQLITQREVHPDGSIHAFDYFENKVHATDVDASSTLTVKSYTVNDTSAHPESASAYNGYIVKLTQNGYGSSYTSYQDGKISTNFEVSEDGTQSLSLGDEYNAVLASDGSFNARLTGATFGSYHVNGDVNINLDSAQKGTYESDNAYLGNTRYKISVEFQGNGSMQITATQYYADGSLSAASKKSTVGIFFPVSHDGKITSLGMTFDTDDTGTPSASSSPSWHMNVNGYQASMDNESLYAPGVYHYADSGAWKFYGEGDYESNGVVLPGMVISSGDGDSYFNDAASGESYTFHNGEVSSVKFSDGISISVANDGTLSGAGDTTNNFWTNSLDGSVEFTTADGKLEEYWAPGIYTLTSSSDNGSTFEKYDVSGHSVNKHGADGSFFLATYDGTNQLTFQSSTDALGNSEWIQYASDRSYTDTLSGNNVWNVKSYDPTGRIVAEDSTLNDGTISHKEFDAQGNVIVEKTTDQYGQSQEIDHHTDGSSVEINISYGTTTTQTFDVTGKLFAIDVISDYYSSHEKYSSDGSSSGIVKNYDGSSQSWTLSSAGVKDSINFDENGTKQSEQITNPDESYITHIFNHSGAVIEVDSYDNQEYVQKNYNDSGQLTFDGHYNDDGTEIEITYDDSGVETSRTWHNPDRSGGADIHEADGTFVQSTDNTDGSSTVTISASTSLMAMATVGGSGDETIASNGVSSFIAGGQGDDTIQLTGQKNIVGYNTGDGVDRIEFSNGASASLSLGGEIDASKISLEKISNDLIIHFSNADAIDLVGWYAGTPHDGLTNLQIIGGGTGTSFNKTFEIFDFKKIVGAFDAASSEDPSVVQWNIINALNSSHIDGSDDQALGGTIADIYAQANYLEYYESAANVLLDPNFGLNSQHVNIFI